MGTELEDKNRQIGDLEFVRRKECAEWERDKEKVIQELELQKGVAQELERKVSGSADELKYLREALRQAQQINAENLTEGEAAIKAAVEEERTRKSPRRMKQREDLEAKVRKSEAEATKWKAKWEELDENARTAANIRSRNLKAREEAEAQVRESHATIEPMKAEIAGVQAEIAALEGSLRRSSKTENDAKDKLEEPACPFRQSNVELQGTLKETERQQKESSAEVQRLSDGANALRREVHALSIGVATLRGRGMLWLARLLSSRSRRARRGDP
jgi:chromosome segregation ATPase